MKRISFIYLLAVASLAVNAQNSKVSSAAVHVDDFVQHQDTSELSEAKAAIDEAAVNEKTKDEPKMYFYRGEIYLMEFQMKLGILAAKMKPAQAYAAMDTNTICTSANSFIKVLQIAPKDYYADETKQKGYMPACLLQLENKAVMEYSNQRYASGLALYEKAIQMDEMLSIMDSTYYDNILNAAIAADKAGNTAKTLKYYQDLIDVRADGATPYEGLVNMYMKQKDTANALNFIQKGRSAYPDDIKLIISETNIFLARGNSDKAETNLLLTIGKVEKQPENKRDKKLLSSLYAVVGNIYDKRANPKGAATSKPADYDNLFAKADSNYSKALQLTPDNFDLLFEMGALFYNRGSYVINDANSLPLSAKEKYDKLSAEAKGYFSQAQPYFEKARTIKPDDHDNNSALREVYSRTGQDDKAKALEGK